MNKTFRAILCLIICLMTSGTVLAKSYEISDYNIELDLTAEGHYLITEEITYDFTEGQFSNGFREVSGKGFGGLEFVSLEGINTSVEDLDVDEGRNLKLNWSFPQATGKRTFQIKYKALRGLVSEGDKNIIDWNPIGSEWDVPINDVDVAIRLPQSVGAINVDPKGDLVSNLDNRVVKLHRDRISSQTYYHVKVTFPKIIAAREVVKKDYLMPILASLVLGLFLAVTDFLTERNARPKPTPSRIKVSELSFAEMAGLYYADSTQSRRGISADIFCLAARGKILLQSKIGKGAFGSQKADVTVEVLSEEELSTTEKAIVNGLKQKKTLKTFAKDYKLLRSITTEAYTSLSDKGLLKKSAIKLRSKTALSSLVTAIPGMISLVWGLVSEVPLLVGLGILLIVQSSGRLIRSAYVPVRTASGMSLRAEIKNLMDTKKQKVDNILDSPAEALKIFFEELPYLLINPRFSSGTLHRYKSAFKKADQFQVPGWLQLDVSALEHGLEALTTMEIINYVIFSTVIIAGSTGASAAGVGAAGSGAGGGGGGAS